MVKVDKAEFVELRKSLYPSTHTAAAAAETSQKTWRSWELPSKSSNSRRVPGIAMAFLKSELMRRLLESGIPTGANTVE